MKCLKPAVGGLLGLLLAIPAASHEFWVEGSVGTSGGAPVVSLDLKVGQHLKGVSLPHIEQNIASFRRVDGGGEEISGRLGSIPAAELAFNGQSGLAVYHQTEPLSVVHNDWQEFLNYLDLEGLDGILDRHVARDLPKTGFTETYTRYAKLVVLGAGGRLPETTAGALFEITIADVRRTEDGMIIGGGLTYAGAALTGHQITIIQRDGQVHSTKTVRTGADGQFEITVDDQARTLLSAVHISDPMDGRAAWHSDWASLYLIPGG